jgi:hypothetical protein
VDSSAQKESLLRCQEEGSIHQGCLSAGFVWRLRASGRSLTSLPIWAFTLPRCRVQRLMRAAGIQGAKRRGKPWRTTTPDPQAYRRPDLVQRDFSARSPNGAGRRPRLALPLTARARDRRVHQLVQQQPPARKPRRPSVARDRGALRCESQDDRTHIMRARTS